MRQIRDPIHGFISITESELKIVDTMPFQRLHHIKQLSTAYLVYPGAEHTRFGHSLGVMHVVTLAFESALENYRDANNGEELFNEVKTAKYRQILRLIALTHDLGHAPFSHGTESLFEKDFDHEIMTREIMFNTEIAELIRKIGGEFEQDHPSDDKQKITPELLWQIYSGKTSEIGDLNDFTEQKFLKSFMDSEIDCDKMDYLLRDSYFCGVEYGKYDLPMLLSSLSVYKSSEYGTIQLAVKRNGVPAFEEFVIARYSMFVQVYFQKTRRYLDILLSKAIKEVLNNGVYPKDVDAYLKLNDCTIIERLKTNFLNSECARQFLERKVMSCVSESKPHATSNSDNRVFIHTKRALSEKIIKGVLEDTAEKSAHKLPVVEVYDEKTGSGIPVLAKNDPVPYSVTDESLLLKGLTTPINIKRLYVDKSNVKEAEEILQDLNKL